MSSQAGCNSLIHNLHKGLLLGGSFRFSPWLRGRAIQPLNERIERRYWNQAATPELDSRKSAPLDFLLKQVFGDVRFPRSLFDRN